MQERAGYFAMDRNGEVYRLTWAAAFRFAFRSLPPMKQILASREERRARALLARMKSEPIKLATAIG
jgi:hypothetical protein